MRRLPAGTVTFLFSDIEGSTRLLDDLGPERYAEALAEHRRVMREAFDAAGGVEVDTQGDAFFVAFADAAGALAAAARAQEQLASGPIRVRMGIHSGEPLLTEEGYVGMDVHQGARVMSAGHGGQVLVSQATRALVPGDGLVELGLHRLKDLTEPQPLYQLGAGEFPPLKTLYQSNLPVQPTLLIGREAELSQVLRLLECSRLVTLTGPGGSGKTRLALQAAAELVDEFPHGVWWVSLASLRDPLLVETTIAQAVGAKDGLAEHLRDRTALLLLDNFEHLLAEAGVVAALLTDARGVRVLATSRERLGLAAEEEYAVPTMPEGEAVALFTGSARRLRPSFEPDGNVSEICRRLDGLPLAVELAAARVKVLTPGQILDRLGKSLELLTGGARDAPERHRTLRATIDWSYDLLNESEKELFTTLAVFDGSFDLAAAEAIVDADLDTLAGLVDKSLVRQTREARFFLLETIRTYAAQLDPSRQGEFRRRHAFHFLMIAESLGLVVEAYERGDTAHYERAALEQHNLRTALGWAVDADPEVGLRLAVALEQFWTAHSSFEGTRWFEALLPHRELVSLELQARALRCYGGCFTISGDFSRARPQYEDSLRLYEHLGDDWAIVHMRHRLATTALHMGNEDHCRTLLEENLDRAKELGSRYLEGEALSVLGVLEAQAGNLSQGLDQLQRSRDIARDVGFLWREAIDLANLARYALAADRLDEAEAYARGALQLAQRMDDRLTTVTSLSTLALCADALGKRQRAGFLWGAVEAEEARQPLGRWSRYRHEFADALLAQLDSDFDHGRAAGRQKELADVVGYALSLD